MIIQRIDRQEHAFSRLHCKIESASFPSISLVVLFSSIFFAHLRFLSVRLSDSDRFDIVTLFFL